MMNEKILKNLCLFITRFQYIQGIIKIAIVKYIFEFCDIPDILCNESDWTKSYSPENPRMAPPKIEYFINSSTDFFEFTTLIIKRYIININIIVIIRVNDKSL